MKVHHFRLFAPVLALLFAISGHAVAAERPLVKANAERKEVRHSMIGPRDTLLFYTFADQQAVLRLRVGNAAESLPVSGTVYLFAPKTTAEELAKWLNNQHSDGLFPEVPEPVETIDLPEGSCQVTEKKLVGETREGPMNKLFRDYRIKVSVKAHQIEGKLDLKGFEDEAGVFVEVKRG